jgi:hypothetical protein
MSERTADSVPGTCPAATRRRSKLAAYRPSKEVWTLSACATCLYVWRSTEPDENRIPTSARGLSAHAGRAAAPADCPRHPAGPTACRRRPASLRLTLPRAREHLRNPTSSPRLSPFARPPGARAVLMWGSQVDALLWNQAPPRHPVNVAGPSVIDPRITKVLSQRTCPPAGGDRRSLPTSPTRCYRGGWYPQCELRNGTDFIVAPTDQRVGQFAVQQPKRVRVAVNDRRGTDACERRRSQPLL